MGKIVISIFNTVGDKYCIEAEEGEKVYKLIKRSFDEKKKVVASFMNVELLTTAFLNTAIGQLYRDFSEEYIRENLAVENMTASGAASLKRVVETAKLYYKDPDALQRSINEILGEE